MKNKKIQFEQLKNKLKNIFFKKYIKVINDTKQLNLVNETENNNDSIDTSKKIDPIQKEKSVYFLKNENNIKNIKPNVEKINNITYIQYKNSPNTNQNKLKLESNIPYSKKIKKETLENKKYSNLKNIIQNNKIINQNIKKYTNKSNKFINILNKTFDFYKSVNLKLVQRPSDIKNINLGNTINSNFEVDEKFITIPSKEQLINLQNNLKLKKADIKKSKNNLNIKNTEIKYKNTKKIEKIREKSNNTYNLISDKNNNSDQRYNLIFNKFNSTYINKNKTLYALPAYQDGTSEPMRTESIGKIHAGEIILNKKQSESFSSMLMKNDVERNLKLNLPEKSETPQTNTDESSNTEQKNNINNILNSENSKKIELANKSMSTSTNEIYKPDLLIKQNIEAPLFTSSLIKNSLPPFGERLLDNKNGSLGVFELFKIAYCINFFFSSIFSLCFLL